MITGIASWKEKKPAVIDGGLAILSKYPLENKDELLYSHSFQADSLASKGCLYATVKHPASDIHVFVTHLQAGFDIYRDVGLSQLEELEAFIRRKTLGSTHPILILGDFNINSRVPSEKNDIDQFMQRTKTVDTLMYDPELLRPSTSLNELRCSIDYILYQDQKQVLTLVETQVMPLEYSKGLTYMKNLSDHCLVRAIFHINNECAPPNKNKGGLEMTDL